MELVTKNPDEDPRVAVLRIDTMNLMGTVSDIKIWDQDSYDYANEVLKDIIRKRKSVDEILGPTKDKAYKAYKSLLGLMDEMKKPFIDLEKRLSPKLSFYLEEQRIIKEEADAEARKIEEDGRLAHAQILEDHDMPEAADKVIDKPIVGTVSTVKKVEQRGTYLVDNWSAEVVSKKELIAAVNLGKVDSELIMPNYQKLNEMARQQKENFNIPGVKAVKQTSTRTRL